MKKLLLTLLIVLLAAVPAVRAEEKSLDPETCADSLEDRRAYFLQSLRELESIFQRKQAWFLKYWDTVYGPLWKAGLNVSDPFSRAKRTEGDLLQKRYASLAEGQLQLAVETRTELKEKLAGLKRAAGDFKQCCDAADVKICLDAWLEPLLRKIDELSTIVERQETDENEFSSRMRASLDESPSDHDELADRYIERLQIFEVYARIKVNRKIAEIEEKVEYDWPVEKCCALCLESSLLTSQDPVLAQLKPDSQGITGVRGKIVNNAGLVPAFEKLEKEKKEKGI